jgi:hypothetical protein
MVDEKSVPETTAPLPSLKDHLKLVATEPATSEPTKTKAKTVKKAAAKPKVVATNGHANGAGDTGIAKPDTAFTFEKFRTKRGDDDGPRVDPYLEGLPTMRLPDAKDFVRLHDDPKYWSPELCFVHVPVKGQKEKLLHLIDEALAFEFLPIGIIIRHRLVLASKPQDTFFLAEVPTQNLDNGYNASAVEGAEACRKGWYMLVSQRAEGIERYKIVPARNQKAFEEPTWPKLSIELLVERTFTNRMIMKMDHPGMLRLLGERQNLK